LLQCLVAAVRPLEVKELAEILAVDFNTEGIPRLKLGWRWADQEEAVMSACSSLVMIVKDGDSRVVQFSHFSVKEFLTANRLAEPTRDVSHFHIRLEAAHVILAQACLGILLRFDDHVNRDSIENFPLARYAAQYWATNTKFGNASSCIKDGMECLFDADKPHFATWLWIHNGYWGGHSMSTMFPEKPKTTPLHYAAKLGFRDLAEHLIAKHPEHVNAKDLYDVTPMHAAASAGCANILSLLLEHGGDVDDRDTDGRTPLHSASSNGQLEAGRCLLDHDADINARNNDGWTPLFAAAVRGRVKFARMLLERRAMIDARARDGRTPLHAAILHRNVDVVRLLLEHDTDVNAPTRTGDTPSMLGSRRGHQEIRELLTKYGANSVKR